MNEPKLRFKADDGSQFPDWEEKKLGDITEKVVRKGANSNADVRMISQGNGCILQSDKYSRENAGQSLKKYTLLKRDEFAYNHGASKVKPYGVCYRLCESDEARVPYVYHTFKLIDGDSGFWNYSLNTSCMDRQLKKMVSSGARMDGLLNIGYDAYMSVNIHVPSLPEQQKIAEFLSTIDTVIAKQKETVSAWEERKKGVMQKLFSQEVRFKADDGSEFPEWEEKKLGDVADFFNGDRSARYPKETDFVKYGVAFLNTENLHNTIVDISEKCKYITYEKYCELSGAKIQLLDIIYCLRGSVGLCSLNTILEEGTVASSLMVIRAVDGIIDPIYLYNSLNSDFVLGQLYQCLNGSCAGNLSAKDMAMFKIKCPCLAEQQKIAVCLSSLDEVIEKQKATLAAWEELKKGLLQQMFV